MCAHALLCDRERWCFLCVLLCAGALCCLLPFCRRGNRAHTHPWDLFFSNSLRRLQKLQTQQSPKVKHIPWPESEMTTQKRKEREKKKEWRNNSLQLPHRSGLGICLDNCSVFCYPRCALKIIQRMYLLQISLLLLPSTFSYPLSTPGQPLDNL